MIYLRWHLGLGDAIVTSGAVRFLRHTDRVTVPCYRHNGPSVKKLFEDDDGIFVEMVESDAEADALAAAMKPHQVLKCGHYAPGFEISRWDRSFYEQLAVPWDERWKFFEPICPQQPHPSGEYAFVHADRGFELTRLETSLPIVRPRRTDTIFEWMAAIKNAREIHLIDSAFACLAASLDCRAIRKTLHAYARKSIPPTLPVDWKVIL